ncbi:MAG TPA: RNA polymerase sigma factor [Candidatus Limnocylindrales bacterium]|nr:RNA polymerase sigma factor [Candidatus Limnocylindrales bacterium]
MPRADLTARGKTCLIVRMNEIAERPGAEMVSDAIAVERTLAGDREAYRVLVERHSRNVYRLAYRMSGNPYDAEEVVQEAFLRAYQKLRQFAGNANFGTWVYRIAANYAIDRMRQRGSEDSRRQQPNRSRQEGLEVDPVAIVPDPAPSPERLAESAQLALRMKEALDSLTPAERTAIVMRHWQGCAIEEIAAVLKSNSNATKNTVFRAVSKLRRALEPFSAGRPAARAMGTES